MDMLITYIQNGGVRLRFIGASLSEPHTRELGGEISVCVRACLLACLLVCLYCIRRTSRAN